MPSIKHINIEYPILYGCFLMFSCIKRFCVYYVHTGGQANHHLPYGSHRCTIWSHAKSAFRQSQKIAQIAKPKRIAAIDPFLLDVGRRQSKNLIKMTGFPKKWTYHNLPMLQGGSLSSCKWLQPL